MTEKIQNLKMYWENLSNNEYDLTSNGTCSLSLFTEKLSTEEIQNNMDIAFEKIPQNTRIEERFKYFCGICWNNIRGKQTYNKRKEEL